MIEPVQIAFRTLRSPEQEELMRKEVLLQPLIDELLALRSIVLVVSERDDGRKRTTTRRYFISSLPGAAAQRLAEAVRSHWGVENRLHWSLDVSFNEDQSRVRAGYAAADFVIVRQIAYNLLKSEETYKAGMRGKRMQCGRRDDYLMKVMLG